MGVFMRQLVLLFLIASSCARAQSPEDLLRHAEQTYKSSDGYEIKGRAVVKLPDSPWQLTADLTIAARPSSPSAAGKPPSPGINIGSFHAVNLNGDSTGAAPSVTFGPPSWAGTA
jgi:hypothetical protein